MNSMVWPSASMTGCRNLDRMSAAELIADPSAFRSEGPLGPLSNTLILAYQQSGQRCPAVEGHRAGEGPQVHVDEVGDEGFVVERQVGPFAGGLRRPGPFGRRPPDEARADEDAGL